MYKFKREKTFLTEVHKCVTIACTRSIKTDADLCGHVALQSFFHWPPASASVAPWSSFLPAVSASVTLKPEMMTDSRQTTHAICLIQLCVSSCVVETVGLHVQCNNY